MADPENYDRDWTQTYYDKLGDQEWQRFHVDAGGRVSLHIHSHYLRQFVAPGSRVLEVGAGPGRFTQILAELGCQVVVADLSPVQLALHKQHASELGFESAVESRQLVDICQLDDFETESFDAVIAYGGPLSYVFDRAPDALAECTRVCKPGGLVLASVMSLWGTSHKFLTGVLELPPADNERITSTGDLTPANHAGVNHQCHMFKSGELRNLATHAGLEVVAMSASGCLALTWADEFAKLESSDSQWQELLRMELEASAEPGCLDMGTHLLLVGKKQ